MASPTWWSARASSAGRIVCSISGTNRATDCSRTLSNVLTNLNLTDMECCYKVFRAEVLRRLRPAQRAVRHRARVGCPRGATRLPHLRGARLVLRPRLRARQEDHLARRVRGRLAHPALLAHAATAAARVPRTPRAAGIGHGRHSRGRPRRPQHSLSSAAGGVPGPSLSTSATSIPAGSAAPRRATASPSTARATSFTCYARMQRLAAACSAAASPRWPEAPGLVAGCLHPLPVSDETPTACPSRP